MSIKTSKDDHPLFEIVTTRTGSVSIRNKELNETMHNPVGPWAEANALYVEQSRLKERLQKDLVLFDVGLGAAANALAVLHCVREMGPSAGKLTMISFERELELLRYALVHSDKFDHFHGYEGAVKSLLESGRWQEEHILWELRHGDFLHHIKHEKHRPHIIYYDPYSSKVNGEMWTIDCFRAVRGISREPVDGGTMLYTYSQATPVRVAILAGGFFVGQGLASGPKEQTTVAATNLNDLEHPLDAEWFSRWEKSHVQTPTDLSTQEAEDLRQWVRSHVQFRA